MEISLIEKADKERYLVIQLVTIGWAIWFGSQIIQDLVSNIAVELIVVFIGFLGFILFLVGLIKQFKLKRKINSSRILKEALANNEMYRLYILKSTLVGFWTAIITTVCLLVTSTFYDISASLACKIILFFCCLSYFIATLVYNKD